MIEVIDLRLRSLDVDYNELSWRIKDTQEDVFEYTFQVLRSEAPAGPFEPISVPFSDRYLFQDRFTVPFHAARVLHYVLRVRNRVSGEEKDFGPVDIQPEADLVAREIRRHMQLLFREFSGRRCWLLPVRTFGQRCTCWEPRLQKRLRSGCPSCYDTGFARGYHNPIEVWAQIEPEPMQEQTSSVGAVHSSDTSAKVANIGNLKPRDLLIEPENRRWRVMAVSQTEHGRAGTHYDVRLHEVPEGDVEYAIELKMEEALRDLALAPARNFTNPHNLESFEREEIPGIFALYGTTYTDPNR